MAASLGGDLAIDSDCRFSRVKEGASWQNSPLEEVVSNILTVLHSDPVVFR